MYSLVSGIYDSYFAPITLNVLMVGSPGVGKTTILERVKVANVVTQSEQSATTESQKSNISFSPPPPSSLIPNKYDDGMKNKKDDNNDNAAACISHHRQQQNQMQQNRKQHQAELRPNTKMLPLEKIRPTYGMNLGKVEIFGAKCNIWDVGGKMESLWERYYKDCDAVIYVWRIGEKIKKESNENENENENSESEDEEGTNISFDEMQSTLIKVRKSIPDDIPFIIIGHIFPTTKKSLISKATTDLTILNSVPSTTSAVETRLSPEDEYTVYSTKYDTAALLPHQFNPNPSLMSLFFCDASTGDGLKSALEWLIPISEKMYKLRNNGSNNIL